MLTTLQKLSRDYPLPAAWRNLSLYEDITPIEDLKLHRCGFTATHRTSKQVIYSCAVSYLQNTNTIRRAYFELLERIALSEAVNEQNEYLAYEATHNNQEQLIHEQVFPMSNQPQRWRYALSNGVAAHDNWQMACKNAQNELIERDSVLRCWHGENYLQRLSTSNISEIEAIQGKLSSFTVEIYKIPVIFDQNMLVSMACIRNNIKETPIFYGFGAARTPLLSLRKAMNEALQRLSYLVELTTKFEPPQFSPTADYHQQYYLTKIGIDEFKQWLNHAEVEVRKQKKITLQKVCFADITPMELKNKAVIVKAISEQCIPLIYGLGKNKIHPVA